MPWSEHVSAVQAPPQREGPPRPHCWPAGHEPQSVEPPQPSAMGPHSPATHCCLVQTGGGGPLSGWMHAARSKSMNSSTFSWGVNDAGACTLLQNLLMHESLLLLLALWHCEFDVHWPASKPDAHVPKHEPPLHCAFDEHWPHSSGNVSFCVPDAVDTWKSEYSTRPHCASAAFSAGVLNVRCSTIGPDGDNPLGACADSHCWPGAMTPSRSRRHTSTSMALLPADVDAPTT